MFVCAYDDLECKINSAHARNLECNRRSYNSIGRDPALSESSEQRYACTDIPPTSLIQLIL